MTRLKALELFGFKSFADRTRFEFPAGITAVVGPNGSGKTTLVRLMTGIWKPQQGGIQINGVDLQNLTTAEEYIRMIALSRIMLPNVNNIQASWLTVGKQTAQVCLQAGANDFGSIMIEENVVSAAGAPHRFTYRGIQDAIREAGFEPQLRNQQYEFRELPEEIEEQVIAY